ncbi:MAG: response regulator [Gemmataceae bacterium]|nr:response regulator [Gemmataceae bacterium]
MSPLDSDRYDSDLPVDESKRRNSPLRRLIVEDNVDAGESLAALLRAVGHEVVFAKDGPQGLERALAAVPDAVLLDIGLPGMDGYEVARQIRQQSLPRRPLLIAVTGYGSEDDRQRSARAGIDLHLTKPVDPGALLQLLTRFASVIR